jgi:hypothetical protein
MPVIGFSLIASSFVFSSDLLLLFLRYGVSCSSKTTSGHVIGIALDKNGLSGLCFFLSLYSYYDISEQALFSPGDLPSSFTDLFLLSVFYLSQNSITGTIPTSVNTLRSLNTIDLGHNLLNGAIPDEMGELVDFSLERVDLPSNSLTGFVPSFFADESTFTSVDLSNNPFICPIPDGAGYTKATCISWTLSYTPIHCLNDPNDNSDLVVYGSGFDSTLEGLKCSITLSATITFGEAHIVSPTQLYCTFPTINFTGCSGREGEKTVEFGDLQLHVESGPISNSLKVNVLNAGCPWSKTSSSGATVNGSYLCSASGTSCTGSYKVLYPSLSSALVACKSGVTRPYRCPNPVVYNSTHPYAYQSVFDLTCADGQSCSWAQIGPYNAPYCPYLYQNSCRVDFSTSYVSYGNYASTPCLGYVVDQ